MSKSEKKQRVRLDQLLFEKGLAKSRSNASALIMAGKVIVKGKSNLKPGMFLSEDAEVEVMPGKKWVGRGGEKLEGALKDFGIDNTKGIWLDCGASTGGFTHVLLSNGANKVYAMDVGYGQLDSLVRNDNRAVVIDRFNIRNISKAVVPELLDGVTLDLSFISSRLILPLLPPFLNSNAIVILLFKPQFEAGKGEVGKGGVIRKKEILETTLDNFRKWCAEKNYIIENEATSQIKGQKGNTEYFFKLKL
ncbi:MAG: TlyA family rRNA (cytidine-2'-O)-methyltransferase [Candidatus Hydrogenedentes bacterium CG07_land_8_20_14_0_80_42_17]|nr:MAG: TlyA family rRNA (cytidine-2'-O)-methyltransferase [Candidatus Hydrogenedentes bacterium CG07_land_8_20_14_0_80_42_17]